MEHTIMSRYRTTMKELLEKVYKEDGHQDVSSSKRMCKTIVEDAQQIESKLNSMSPEDSLDTWWTNKLAVSANNLNKARDYIVNDIKEELELDEGKMKTIATMFDQGQSAKEIAKKLKLPLSTVKAILGEGINPYVSMQRDSKTGKMNYVVLDKDEKEAFSSQNYILAKDYLKKNYDKLKEEVILEFSDSMLDKLAREYQPLKGKTISVDQANKLRKIFDRIPDRALDALRRKKIPFLSGLALSRMIKKGMPVKEELELDENRVNDIKKKAKEFGVDVSVDAMGPFKSKQVNVKGFKTQSGMNKFMKYVADMGKDFLTIKDETEIEEAIDPATFGPDKVAKAMAIATKSSGNYSKAVRDIERIARNLSKVSTIARELQKQNESLDEKKATITIDKITKPSVHKQITDVIRTMGNKAPKVTKTANGYVLAGDDKALTGVVDYLFNKELKNIINPKNPPFDIKMLKAQYEAVEEPMPKDEPKKDNEKKEAENKDKQIAALKDQISMLKTKIENEKNKAVKPEPNPDTGEVPLTVGVAYKHFKDKMKKEETLEEISPADKKKRLQRAKDMIKYYDMMKKKALKGPNKALAKKMLKSELEEETDSAFAISGVETQRPTEELQERDGANTSSKKGSFAKSRKPKYRFGYRVAEKQPKGDDIEEATMVSDISGISITALKRETAKFNIKVARVTPGGPMGAEYEVTFTGREQDLIRYAKEHFGFDDKPGTFQQLKKHLNMDYVPEADLTKKQVKMVHKVADDLPKKDFKDRYGKEKGDAVRFGTATNMVKKKLGMKENTSAFNPSVHNKVLGVTSKDLDRAFKKLSQRAQTHVNDLLRTGMGARDAIKKAKEKFKEINMNEDKRLYVETIAGLKKKAEKSGMPYSILKKVYDRGIAAWKSGHRPGASQQQWAFARVNSFVTKSSGTWGGADKDLAKQVRGSK